jgi:tetratricopeptide (TPR) repeat protein
VAVIGVGAVCCLLGNFSDRDEMSGSLLCFILAVTAQEASVSAPTGEQIARAVEELGASRFEAREAATNLLWKAGQAADAALGQAAKSNDPEVRTRATALLNKLRLGIRPDTPPEMLALIDQFRYAADANQRRQALNQLQAKGHWQTVLTLIRGEQNPQERRNLATAIAPDAGKIVSSLVEKGDLNQAEEILELVATSEPGLPQLLAFLVVTNRLDQRIADARERAEEQPRDEQWVRLAYLLRAKGDRSGAIQAAEKSADLVLRTNLLAEAQRWREAAGFAEDLYRRNPGRLEPAAFAATYYRLAGESGEHERAMNALLKAANVEWLNTVGERKGADPFGGAANLAVNNFAAAAKALVINERIDEALAILRKINPQFAHIVYWKQHRHREALELAKVTPEKTLDAAWLDELLPPPPLAPVDATFRFTLAAQVARELRELGRQEQVDQIWTTLSELEPAESERGRQAGALAQLAWQLRRENDAMEQAAKAIGAKITPAAILAMFAGKEAPLALAWHERFVLQKWEQPKAIATAVQMVAPNPRRGGPPENWRQIVADARQSLRAMAAPSRAARLVAFGHTCKIRGDDALAKELFQEAADANPASSMDLGDLLAAQEKWEEAAERYAAVVKANPANTTVRYLWGQALSKVGDKNAADRQILLANLSVLAPEARYELAKGIMKPGLKENAMRPLELVQRTALPDSIIAVTAGQEIGNIVSRHEPRRSAECWQQLLLHMLNSSAGFNQPEAYPILSHLIHKVLARAAIDEGDAKTAAAELARCEALIPADINTVLQLTPPLRRAGMDRAADELLEHALATHRTVLEAFPASATYLNNAAWLCARTQRQLDEALALAQKAVELAPDESAYQDTLAEVHFQRGDREGAVAAAQRCVEIAPDNKLFASRLKHFQEDELKTLDGIEMQ